MEMQMDSPIINKVALSPLVTIDLEEFRPAGEMVQYDIRDNLFMGLILKEKDFRDFIKNHDWSRYQGKNMAITCSADAIVPTWAYMLLTHALKPYAQSIFFGTKEEAENNLWLQTLGKLDFEQWRDKKLVVKGCGDNPIPVAAYVEITNRLGDVAKSVMYGEPCSTVPVFKNK